jgi:hypothetical protein
MYKVSLVVLIAVLVIQVAQVTIGTANVLGGDAAQCESYLNEVHCPSNFAMCSEETYTKLHTEVECHGDDAMLNSDPLVEESKDCDTHLDPFDDPCDYYANYKNTDSGCQKIPCLPF